MYKNTHKCDPYGRIRDMQQAYLLFFFLILWYDLFQKENTTGGIAMTIKLDDKLLEHMKKEDYHDIILNVITCQNWQGTYKQVSTRFVEGTNEELDTIYESHDSELGKVYFKSGTIDFQDNAEIQLVQLLWAKKIVLKGIRASKQSY